MVSGRARTAVLIVVGLLLSLVQAAVAAGITVSRAELDSGQLLVQGSGAVPNASISIDGVARGKADGTGAFKIQFEGFKSTSCVITVSDGTSSARATLSGCTPTGPALSTLTLSPTSVLGGSTSKGTATLTGAAPTGGTVVTLSSKTPTVATVPASVTVPAGATSMGFSISTVSVTASTSVTISASLGGVTKTAILTVTPSLGPAAPTPLAPANGASVPEPLTISWSAVTDPSGIIAYNWQISPSSSLTPVIMIGSTSGQTQDVVNGLAAGTYFWRVQAVSGAFVQGAWSRVSSFIVTGVGPGAPGTPTLAPTQAYSTFHPMEVIRFSWTAVAGAATYVLQASTDPSFPVLTRFQFDNIPNPAFSFAIGDSNQGNYYARVYAVDATGIAGAPSNVITFSVFFTNPLPPPPSPVSPANGVTLTLPVTPTWTAVPNPQPGGYELQIAKDSAFSTIEILAPQLNGQSYTVLSLTSGTKFWRVRSMQGDASPTTAAVTAWSTTGTFAVSSAPPTPVSLTLTTNPLFSGDSTWVAVQLTAAAPAGGAAITLTSSNPAAAPVPATITMQGNIAWMQFQIQAGQVGSAASVTLTATLNSGTASVQFTVLPPSLKSLTISPSTISGGAQPGAIVMLNGQAPAGGAVVSLTSNSPAASPPATATVAPGSFSVSFPIPTSTVTANTVVTITVSWNGVSAQAQVTLTPQLPPTSLTLSPTSTIGTGGSSFGTVAIASPALSDEILQVTSSNPAVAQVNNGVMIPAGVTRGGFNIFTVSVTVQTLVTISVSGGGVTKSATLTVNPDTPPPPLPSADTVKVTLCEYNTATKVLRVGATSTSSSATLTVVVSSTGVTIGTLTNNGGGKYSGQFGWSVNPQSITVKSALGGSASCTVVAVD